MIRLAVRVRREHAELVLAELLELTPAGVEESDVGEDLVEYAVYGAPGELPGLPNVRAAVGDALVHVTTSEVADDWHERWRQFHRPVLIAALPATDVRSAVTSTSTDASAAPTLWVRPPWEEPDERPMSSPSLDVVIDPGQAFGTGGHATTRLCLQLLLELVRDEGAGGPLLDVGTGSGVIAIAAAMLGYAPVLGLDNEHESVTAARANAQTNGVALEARAYDLRAEPLPWAGDGGAPAGGGDLVVTANLLRPLLLRLADAIERPPRRLIAGGLLLGEADEVARAFAERLDLKVGARRESGEWCALLLAAA